MTSRRKGWLVTMCQSDHLPSPLICQVSIICVTPNCYPHTVICSLRSVIHVWIACDPIGRRPVQPDMSTCPPFLDILQSTSSIIRPRKLLNSYSLTCSLTYSPTYSLTNSLTYTHLLNHLLTHLFTHLLTYLRYVQ